jgi:hypothetical protein
VIEGKEWRTSYADSTSLLSVKFRFPFQAQLVARRPSLPTGLQRYPLTCLHCPLHRLFYFTHSLESPDQSILSILRPEISFPYPNRPEIGQPVPKQNDSSYRLAAEPIWIWYSHGPHHMRKISSDTLQFAVAPRHQTLRTLGLIATTDSNCAAFTGTSESRSSTASSHIWEHLPVLLTAVGPENESSRRHPHAASTLNRPSQRPSVLPVDTTGTYC